MPFESEAQRRWMHATHPEMAERWEKHTTSKKLPEKKHPKETVKKKAGEYTPDGAKGMLESMERDVRGGPAIHDTSTVKEKKVSIKCGALERVFFHLPASESQEELAERLVSFAHAMNPEKVAADGANLTDEAIETAFAKRAADLTRGERYAFQFAPQDVFAQ